MYVYKFYSTFIRTLILYTIALGILRYILYTLLQLENVQHGPLSVGNNGDTRMIPTTFYS